MEKVLNIITIVLGLLTKVLDLYSGLLAAPIFKTVFGLIILCALIFMLVLKGKFLLYIFLRPMMQGMVDWSTNLLLDAQDEQGTKKPYVLKISLQLKESVKLALADYGLYTRTDSDVLCGALINRARGLFEDASFCEGKGMKDRYEALKHQSYNYLELERSISKNREGRIMDGQDYYTDLTYLEELNVLASEPANQNHSELFAAMLYNTKHFHAFRNLIRAISIRPDGIVLRFHTENRRNRYAESIDRGLRKGIPFILFNWLIHQNGKLFPMLRYISKSVGCQQESVGLPNDMTDAYEIHYEVHDRSIGSTMKFDIISKNAVLLKRLSEAETIEIIRYAAIKATQDGLILGNIIPIEQGSVGVRRITSERMYFENKYDMILLAPHITKFVQSQIAGIKVWSADKGEV